MSWLLLEWMQPNVCSKWKLIYDLYLCAPIIILTCCPVVCGLLMPKHAQQAYFALLAFNVELASIKDNSIRLRGGGFGGGSDTGTLAIHLKFQRWKDL